MKFSLKFQEIPRSDLKLFKIDNRQGSLYSVLNTGKFSSNFELKLVNSIISKFYEGSKFLPNKALYNSDINSIGDRIISSLLNVVLKEVSWI